jgi:AraC-like DNA-binding protein
VFHPLENQRVFRREFGMTPRDYRRRARGEGVGMPTPGARNLTPGVQ